MTFKEANKNMDSEPFGLEFEISLCEGCVHANECTFSDFNEPWTEESPAITSKCNFYDDDLEGHL